MKKITVSLFAILFAFTAFSQNPVAKPKVKFAHSAGRNCGQCLCPFGICILITIGIEEITPDEARTGLYGYVTAQVKDGKLNFIFENRAALDDGTTPFDADMVLAPNTCKALGFNSITIKAGNYKVDYSRFPKFGEVNLDIVTN